MEEHPDNCTCVKCKLKEKNSYADGDYESIPIDDSVTLISGD